MGCGSSRTTETSSNKVNNTPVRQKVNNSTGGHGRTTNNKSTKGSYTKAGGEMLNIGIGKCGAQLCLGFFDEIAKEHGLISGKSSKDSNLIDYNEGFFDHNGAPRAVLVDYTQDFLNDLGSFSIFPNISKDNIFWGETASNGVSVFSKDNKVKETVSDKAAEKMRKLTEACDNLLGLNYFYNIASDSSGLVNSICDNFGLLKPTILHCLAPSNMNEDLPALNTMFGVSQTIECSDLTIIYNANSVVNYIQSNNYQNGKQLFAKSISGLTSILRSNGQHCNSLARVYQNLVLYPRAHFLGINYFSSNQAKCEAATASSLFSDTYSLSQLRINSSPLLNGYFIFRGDYNFLLAVQNVNNERRKLAENPFGNTNITCSFANLKESDSNCSGVSLFNHASVIENFTSSLETVELFMNDKKYEDLITPYSDYTSLGQTVEDFKALIMDYQEVAVPSDQSEK